MAPQNFFCEAARLSLRNVHRRFAVFANACQLAFAPQRRFKFGKNAQHLQEGFARRC
jgi:hypothetical protein